MQPTDLSPSPAPRSDEFERFFMLAFDMCCVASLDGFFRRVNPAFVRGLGYSEAELLARPFYEWLHPEDVAETAAEFARLSEGGAGRNYVNRYRHQDGTYRWLEWMASAAEGLVYAVARDVTDARRVAEALRQSEHQFRMLAENATDVILLTTPAGVVQYASPAGERLLGYDAEALVGKRIVEFIHPEDLPAATTGHLTALQTGSAEARYRVMARDGREAWLEVFKKAVCDPETGAVVGVQAISRDITERCRMELALRASEERLRAIFDYSLDAVVGLSTAGLVESWNPAAERLFGYTAGEMLGQSFQLLLPPTQDEARIRFGLEGQPSAPHAFETELRHRAGHLVPVDVTLSPIPGESGELRGYSAILHDIRERRELDRLKEQFVSTVAHELRTPLSSIYGSLKLMASGKLDQDPANRQRILDIAVTNADRLARIIDDLLEHERLQSGRAVMDRVACNGQDLLLQLEDTMRPVADKAGIRLEVDIPETLPMWADPDRVLQILLNLVGNALKFTPSGRSVRVGGCRTEEAIRFEVADEGRGIPPTMRERIFDRFQQVASSDARDKGGSGLGLAICRGLVQAHGGRIGVDSEEGVGSTFWFTLPLDHSPSA
ncbi:MAG TPA: PAS domain S-box protein [Stenomitos sp.]